MSYKILYIFVSWTFFKVTLKYHFVVTIKFDLTDVAVVINYFDFGIILILKFNIR